MSNSHYSSAEAVPAASRPPTPMVCPEAEKGWDEYLMYGGVVYTIYTAVNASARALYWRACAEVANGERAPIYDINTAGE